MLLFEALGILGLIFVATLSAVTGISPWALGLVTFLLVIGVVAIWSTAYRIEITDAGICLTDLLSTHCLSWPDIEVAKANMGYLLLKGKGGHVSIQISAQQVSAYAEIVDLVRRKRPDLWKTPNLRTFHRSRWALIGYGGFGAILVLAGLFRLFTGDIFIGAMSIIGGIVLVLPATLGTPELTMTDDAIIIEQWGRKEKVLVSQIVEIYLMPISPPSQWMSYGVGLVLKDKRQIALNGFEEGNEIVYNVLQQWFRDSKTISQSSNTRAI